MGWVCQSCREEIEEPFDACWSCGTDRAGRPDSAFRRADEPDPPPPPSAGVSAVCPACGSVEYRPIRPAEWIAYIPDRVCTVCGTRYAPPTPRWAGVTLVLLGSAMVLGAVVSVLIRLATGNPIAIVSGVSDVLFGLLGGAAVRYGVRTLRRPAG